jgi:hypothetical protein
MRRPTSKLPEAARRGNNPARVVFLATVAAPAAEVIAHGDLPGFLEMLGRGGGLTGMIRAQDGCSFWQFESAWDLARFVDFLVTEIWNPDDDGSLVLDWHADVVRRAA